MLDRLLAVTPGGGDQRVAIEPAEQDTEVGADVDAEPRGDRVDGLDLFGSPAERFRMLAQRANPERAVRPGVVGERANVHERILPGVVTACDSTRASCGEERALGRGPWPIGGLRWASLEKLGCFVPHHLVRIAQCSEDRR